ncbi:MAG: NAD(P)-binding protein, partial [Candidatus Hodarchaeales archaeon]
MDQYDFVIIGSGTSGAVWAYYLTKEGFSCLMLEAGKEYT